MPATYETRTQLSRSRRALTREYIEATAELASARRHPLRWALAQVWRNWRRK